MFWSKTASAVLKATAKAQDSIIYIHLANIVPKFFVGLLPTERENELNRWVYSFTNTSPRPISDISPA